MVRYNLGKDQKVGIKRSPLEFVEVLQKIMMKYHYQYEHSNVVDLPCSLTPAESLKF